MFLQQKFLNNFNNLINTHIHGMESNLNKDDVQVTVLSVCAAHTNKEIVSKSIIKSIDDIHDTIITIEDIVKFINSTSSDDLYRKTTMATHLIQDYKEDHKIYEYFNKKYKSHKELFDAYKEVIEIFAETIKKINTNALPETMIKYSSQKIQDHIKRLGKFTSIEINNMNQEDISILNINILNLIIIYLYPNPYQKRYIIYPKISESNTNPLFLELLNSTVLKNSDSYYNYDILYDTLMSKINSKTYLTNTKPNEKTFEDKLKQDSFDYLKQIVKDVNIQNNNAQFKHIISVLEERYNTQFFMSSSFYIAHHADVSFVLNSKSSELTEQLSLTDKIIYNQQSEKTKLDLQINKSDKKSNKLQVGIFKYDAEMIKQIKENQNIKNKLHQFYVGYSALKQQPYILVTYRHKGTIEQYLHDIGLLKQENMIFENIASTFSIDKIICIKDIKDLSTFKIAEIQKINTSLADNEKELINSVWNSLNVKCYVSQVDIQHNHSVSYNVQLEEVKKSFLCCGDNAGIMTPKLVQSTPEPTSQQVDVKDDNSYIYMSYINTGNSPKEVSIIAGGFETIKNILHELIIASRFDFAINQYIENLVSLPKKELLKQNLNQTQFAKAIKILNNTLTQIIQLSPANDLLDILFKCFDDSDNNMYRGLFQSIISEAQNVTVQQDDGSSTINPKLKKISKAISIIIIIAQKFHNVIKYKKSINEDELKVINFLIKTMTFIYKQNLLVIEVLNTITSGTEPANYFCIPLNKINILSQIAFMMKRRWNDDCKKPEKYSIFNNLISAFEEFNKLVNQINVVSNFTQFNNLSSIKFFIRNIHNIKQIALIQPLYTIDKDASKEQIFKFLFIDNDKKMSHNSSDKYKMQYNSVSEFMETNNIKIDYDKLMHIFTIIYKNNNSKTNEVIDIYNEQEISLILKNNYPTWLVKMSNNSIKKIMPESNTQQ